MNVRRGLAMGTALVISLGGLVATSTPAAAYDNWCTPGTTELLAEIWSTAGVGQPPTKASTVTFSAPVKIDSILTYHWNAPSSETPGTISLVADNGKVYGPWKASGAKVVPAGQHYCAYPNQVVPAGTYKVVDSRKGSWSQVDGRGMLKIFGSPNATLPTTPTASAATYDNWCKPGKTELLGEIWSTAAVGQPPTAPSVVTFTAPVRIGAILTYHWNANGDKPGTISLVSANGKTYGPYKASGSQVVPADKHFCAYPDQVVPAGSYTVVDSQKGTWSQVDGRGMVKIFGSTSPSGKFTIKCVKGKKTIKVTGTNPKCPKGYHRK